MKTAQAIEYFGSKAKLAKILGVHRSAVTLWGDEVPKSRQYQLQVLSNGLLMAEQTTQVA